MKTKFKSFFFLLSSCVAFSQPSGFWDKERATSKEVIVSARNRIMIPTEELPVGTTEIVYRITLLDENQQLANSLVSVLKAIPDPSGISQGSAGAVFLLSKISGDDKCKYAIFTSRDFAANYKDYGKTDKACLFQDNPINKDAKRLSMTSTCLKSNILWFGFESKNWIMNQRVVLEVVPWIDYKLSAGWNIENKKSVIAICKSTDLAKKIPDSDEYCVCVLDKLQSKYRFNEYQTLLAAEKTKAFKDAGTACYTETNASVSIYNNLRTEAAQLAATFKYAEAAAKLQTIIDEGKATPSDYNALALNSIFTRQYDKALKLLNEAEKRDPSDLLIQMNLAHTYLLKGDYSHAKAIHKKYKTQNATNTLRWADKVKIDFAAFEKAGLPTTNFKKVLDIVE